MVRHADFDWAQRLHPETGLWTLRGNETGHWKLLQTNDDPNKESSDLRKPLGEAGGRRFEAWEGGGDAERWKLGKLEGVVLRSFLQ